MSPHPEPQILDEGPLRCLVHVPADTPPPESGWPVLCFLHGYDEAAPLAIERALTRHGPLWPGSSPLARRHFMVVAPQLPAAGDVWPRHVADVEQLLDELQARHGGDRRRSYLTGFSFGGNGVFDLALARPRLWGALWAVDPTRVPQRDPHGPIWLSVGEVARYRKQRFIEALRLQPANAAGRVDADRVYLDRGEDHVGSARSAYADDRIYHWLLAHRVDAVVP